MQPFVEREAPLGKDLLLARRERRGEDFGVTPRRKLAETAFEADARESLRRRERHEIADSRVSPPGAEPILLGPDIDDFEASHACNCRLWGDPSPRHGGRSPSTVSARVILVVTHERCGRCEVGIGQHFAPPWILVSAGFGGHRLDPLAQLGLTQHGLH